SGLRVAVAERHVDGAADLFIEEDVANALLDAEVVAKGKFTKVTRALVELEHLREIVLALGRRGLGDAPALEAQSDILNAAAVDCAGNGEANMPLRAIFVRTGEELSAGEIALAVAVAERTPGKVQAQIGIGAHDTGLALVAQPVHVELLARA